MYVYIHNVLSMFVIVFVSFPYITIYFFLCSLSYKWRVRYPYNMHSFLSQPVRNKPTTIAMTNRKLRDISCSGLFQQIIYWSFPIVIYACYILDLSFCSSDDSWVLSFPSHSYISSCALFSFHSLISSFFLLTLISFDSPYS